MPVDEGEKSEAKASLHVRVQAIEGPGNNSTPPKPITRGNTDLPPAGRALCPLECNTPSLAAAPPTVRKPQEPPGKLGAAPLKAETNKDKEEELQLRRKIERLK